MRGSHLYCGAVTDAGLLSDYLPLLLLCTESKSCIQWCCWGVWDSMMSVRLSGEVDSQVGTQHAYWDCVGHNY